jgi:hypothetical protein
MVTAPAPPEDVGGPPGYAELLEALADPAHEDHDQMREWTGNRLRSFNPATDRRIKQMVGEIPETVRLLVGLTGDGARLTPGRAATASTRARDTTAAPALASDRASGRHRG